MKDEEEKKSDKNNRDNGIKKNNEYISGIKIIKINVNKFIEKLCRRVNSSLYYNKDYCTLLKGEELKVIPVLLLYLYNNREKFGKKIKGIQSQVIYDNCKLSEPAIKLWLAKLFPLINMSFYKKRNGRLSRYYSLNENGMIVCEKLLGLNKK